ncbi:MAG: hypothetical protein IIX09_07135, partial [Clostridia bacterium]|nr:hypothetical protein [Clostridia bacterium]
MLQALFFIISIQYLNNLRFKQIAIAAYTIALAMKVIIAIRNKYPYEFISNLNVLESIYKRTKAATKENRLTYS